MKELLDKIKRERDALSRSVDLLEHGIQNRVPEIMLLANRLAIKEHLNKLAELVA